MTSDNTFTYHTLSNGLRIVHRRTNSPVEYCGLAVKAGSRDESPEQYGLAHFVEHTIFKGTDRRRSWHIINRMESVGGDLNAYTSEEVTVLHSGFPSGHLERAVELMADLIGNSRFPEAQIDREREVILDEVDSYLDSPSEAIFDDFNDLLFAGSPLGHNILGNAQTISSFTPETCREFLSRYYTPGNMVFFYMGSTDPGRVFRLVEKHMSGFDHPTPPSAHTVPRMNASFDIYRRHDTHQSHTIIGARIPGMYDRSKRTFALLNNIIGGPCMNSLLNVALRERRGYVYSVDSYTSLFTDCGELTIYFGCDPEHVKPCRKIILETLYDLASSAMKPRALEAAKKQYIGQMTVGSDNREQAAISTGRAMLFYGYAAPTKEIIESINAITADDLRRAAEYLAPDKCSTLTFG